VKVFLRLILKYKPINLELTKLQEEVIN